MNQQLAEQVTKLAYLQMDRHEIALHLNIKPERLEDGGDLCKPWMKGLIQAKVEARLKLYEKATGPDSTTQAIVSYLKLCDRFQTEPGD